MAGFTSQEFSIRILLFGSIELDLPTPVSPLLCRERACAATQSTKPKQELEPDCIRLKIIYFVKHFLQIKIIKFYSINFPQILWRKLSYLKSETSSFKLLLCLFISKFLLRFFLLWVTRLGNFLPVGLLLVAHYDFLKRQSSPSKWLLFAQANLLHFHLNKHFQNMIFKSGLM
jgi:hypothetical protein